MAKDAKPAEGGEQAAPAAPPRSKKLLIIIIAAVFLLVIIGGVVGFFLLKKSPDENADEEDAAETTSHSSKKDSKKKDAHPPVFVTLEPFTVNLVPENGDQYLQVALALECEDPTADAQIKASMPKIRNGITLLLSSKKASELATRDGKEHLAEELKSTVNGVFEAPPPPKKGKKGAEEEAAGLVKEVLFTSFIIQ